MVGSLEKLIKGGILSGKCLLTISTALGSMKEYGPENGLTAEDIAGYHYTFGMEYFDEPLELAEGSHSKLVSTIEKNLGAKKIKYLGNINGFFIRIIFGYEKK